MTAVEAMNAELTLLLEIQDLITKVKELEAGAGLVALEREHFGIDPAEAAGQARARVTELVEQLPEPIRRRYDRIAEHLDRVVVPVIAGTCYGCFVSIPTATLGEEDPNASLRTCQHCGRFLYILS